MRGGHAISRVPYGDQRRNRPSGWPINRMHEPKKARIRTFVGEGRMSCESSTAHGTHLGVCLPSEFLRQIGNSDGDCSFNRFLEVFMCTNCLTVHIRTLGDESDFGPHYTLRAGHGLMFGGLLIVGHQDEIATFEFVEYGENDELITREDDETTTAALVSAHVHIIDPAGWARFLPAYASYVGMTIDHYEAIVADLEAEAVTLFPRLDEFMEESHRMVFGDEEDEDDDYFESDIPLEE